MAKLKVTIFAQKGMHADELVRSLLFFGGNLK